jgi:DNA-binding CsgD family transcriptional regulator
MVTENQILRLALMAYEAAAEPTRWPDFMKEYTEAVSADVAVFQIHDHGQHLSTIFTGFGISSPFKQSYNEHYSKLNVWRERGSKFFSPGRINIDEELCPRAVIETSEFYNDYLLRIGCAYSMGAVVAREGSRNPTLTALRSPGKHQFGEEERRIAHFLLPHLSRAWSILGRLEMLGAGERILDTLPLGVMFLSNDRKAIYHNRAADEIFHDNDGLQLRHGVLYALDRRADAELRKAVDHALSRRSSPGPAAIAVPRVSLRREYHVVAAPLVSQLGQFVGMPVPVAVVLITDPDRQKPASADLLMQIYKLTPKEAAIAVKLSEGKSVHDAAAELEMTYETARTHLRRIFSKTETSRQTDLLLLMARLPTCPDHGQPGMGQDG